MRTFWAIILGGILSAAGSLGGLVYLAHTPQHKAESRTSTVNVEDFKLTTEQIVKDMHTRAVSIPPLGQLWAFTPGQKINITVLQKKPLEDNVVVAVKVMAIAKVQPQAPDPKNEKGVATTNKATTPVTVQLDGVAKLNYELIAGEWYLLDITSVSLHATQK